MRGQCRIWSFLVFGPGARKGAAAQKRARALLYLLFIGIVVLLGALVFGALRMRHRPGRRQTR
jgi:hypothetical protein